MGIVGEEGEGGVAGVKKYEEEEEAKVVVGDVEYINGGVAGMSAGTDDA